MNLPGLCVTNVNPCARLSLHRQSIEIVARWLSVFPPLVKRAEHVEGVVSRTKVEVGVIVLHRQGKRLAGFVGEHSLLALTGHLFLVHCCSSLWSIMRPVILEEKLFKSATNGNHYLDLSS